MRSTPPCPASPAPSRRQLSKISSQLHRKKPATCVGAAQICTWMSLWRNTSKLNRFSNKFVRVEAGHRGLGDHRHGSLRCKTHFTMFTLSLLPIYPFSDTLLLTSLQKPARKLNALDHVPVSPSHSPLLPIFKESPQPYLFTCKPTCPSLDFPQRINLAP